MLKIKSCALSGETGHEAGRRLLRELYAAEIGGEMPDILISPRGKPYFSQGNLHFSISHTRRHAFCALSDRPVGIDAEESDRAIRPELLKKALSASEFARCAAFPDPNQAFLRLWVLKEAAAKLSGQGLRGYPNTTAFSPEDPRVELRDGCFFAIMQEEEYAL